MKLKEVRGRPEAGGDRDVQLWISFRGSRIVSRVAGGSGVMVVCRREYFSKRRAKSRLRDWPKSS